MARGAIFIIPFSALLTCPALASDHQRQPLAARIPDAMLTADDDRFLTLTVENDYFGSGTDQNYTNGVRLTYFDLGDNAPAPARWLASLVPTFELNHTTSVYYSIGQNLFTPENITRSIPDPDDRPYAGFLYGSAGFTSVTNNHVDELEMTLGVVGPVAFGEEVQANFHELINSNDPRGWDHQLENEPGLMLSWQRRWPEAYAAPLGEDWYFRAMPHIGGTLGNIYTYANTGLTLQLMPKRDRWQSQPLRVRPAIPGSGFFSTPERNWSWMLFAGVDGRATGRNIFLDGNTFENSPSVDKKYFVADASAGLALTYGSTRITYTINWRSKEFDNQDGSHVFGAISLGYRF